jgi:hypothetical protein
MQKHKWHDEICAWASGVQIQGSLDGICWEDCSRNYMPEFFNVKARFRIKPASKPDVVWYCKIWPEGFGVNHSSYDECIKGFTNLGIAKLTINGETGKPSVEVVE